MMRISDLIASCLRSLFRRKVRTLLTIIGVVIGTCAIVVTISLGEGMNRSQMEMISQWTDLTTIQVYQNWAGEDPAKLDAALVDSINGIEHVKACSPVMSMNECVTVYAGKYAYTGEIRAVNFNILEDMGYELIAGNYPAGEVKNLLYFGEETPYYFQDSEHPDRWVNYEYDDEGNIISDPPFDPSTVKLTYKHRVENLDPLTGDYWGDEDKKYEAQNKQNTVEEQKLSYGGTMKGDYSKDDGSTIWSLYIDIDLAVQLRKDYNKLNNITPTDLYGNKVDPNYVTYDQIIVKVDDMSNVDAVQKEIDALGYSTYSFESQRKPLEEQTRQIQLLFGGLGAISMLVAAIGIANTMVMSIYERTREIGVMKVLGCELKDIRLMFLVEAGMIGMTGGVIGLGLSFAIGAIINAFAQEGSYTSVIPLWLVLLGLGFSLIVGVVSGFSPANRAVRISALSAIRQE